MRTSGGLLGHRDLLSSMKLLSVTKFDFIRLEMCMTEVLGPRRSKSCCSLLEQGERNLRPPTQTRHSNTAFDKVIPAMCLGMIGQVWAVSHQPTETKSRVDASELEDYRDM